jgi:protein-S-isoprenylcysteine O-methyltransferase Ste14
MAGGWVSVSGLVVRALAAGSIHKERELATGGPYRIIRHPLYVGSFLVGMGLALAGRRWWLPLAFVALFFWMYGRTIRAEEARLEGLFGPAYREYQRRVPAFLPRIDRRSPSVDGPGFRSWLYWRNKEWQTAVGTFTGYGLLWARMWLLG